MRLCMEKKNGTDQLDRTADSISQSSCKCIMNIQSRKSDVSSIPFDTENTDGLVIFSDMMC